MDVRVMHKGCSSPDPCYPSIRRPIKAVLIVSAVYLTIPLLFLLAPSIISSSASRTEDTSLWIGERKKVIEVSVSDGKHLLVMPAEHLEDIAVDNNRNTVWVGTRREIIRYTLQGEEVFRYPLNIKDDSDNYSWESDDSDADEVDSERVVHISLSPAEDSLWIGAKDEVIKLSSDGQKLFDINLSPKVLIGEDIGHIQDVSVDVSDNSCWVGLKNKAIKYSSDGTPILTFNLEDGNKIQALSADPLSNSLWLGTKKGIIKINKNGLEEIRISAIEDVQDLKIDFTDASLWLITKKQVFRYSNSGDRLLYLKPCPEGG